MLKVVIKVSSKAEVGLMFIPASMVIDGAANISFVVNGVHNGVYHFHNEVFVNENPHTYYVMIYLMCESE